MHPARPRFGRLGTQPKANEEGRNVKPRPSETQRVTARRCTAVYIRDE